MVKKQPVPDRNLPGFNYLCLFSLGADPEDNGQVRATIWPPVEIVALIMALHHGMVSNKFEKKKSKSKFLAGNQVDHVILLVLLLNTTKNYVFELNT